MLRRDGAVADVTEQEGEVGVHRGPPVAENTSSRCLARPGINSVSRGAIWVTAAFFGSNGNFFN